MNGQEFNEKSGNGGAEIVGIKPEDLEGKSEKEVKKQLSQFINKKYPKNKFRTLDPEEAKGFTIGLMNKLGENYDNLVLGEVKKLRSKEKEEFFDEIKTQLKFLRTDE